KDKDQATATGDAAHAGLLGRVETFLPGATKGETGLLNAGDVAAKHGRGVTDAKDADKDEKKDKFGKSDWTKEG
ncbi:hypothetical protein, partial [Acinetobacter baumannii]|uniref:hypothetical protein n=1 Tax=Acinetobacter baumannii TaxID=470 RepID=UPI0013D7BF67